MGGEGSIVEIDETIYGRAATHPKGRGPFGAKEVGQGPLLPIMPAVANAVYDAVGVRIDEVPISPEKIVKALAEKKAGRVTATYIGGKCVPMLSGTIEL